MSQAAPEIFSAWEMLGALLVNSSVTWREFTITEDAHRAYSIKGPGLGIKHFSSLGDLARFLRVDYNMPTRGARQ